MKKFLVPVCLACLLAAPTTAFAQSDEAMALLKQREELRKASKSELNEKATKTARKEAKKLEKEGWKIAPGALPLEKQMDKSYLMQMQYDDNMYPKFIMSEGMSTGENYDAAKMQALELAKQNLSSQIQTEITALIENSVATSQLAAEEAASVTKSISAGKSLITQSLGRTITVVECYRTLPNKNKEVLLRIAYNGEMAKAVAKKAIRENLEGDANALQGKLDNVLGAK